MAKAVDKLRLAEKQLERVQAAWDEPTDWADLSLYGFYCLENAVAAAAIHFRVPISRKHWEKADVAHQLHVKHKMPDVSDLLRDLNEARKANVYGDVPAPSLKRGRRGTENRRICGSRKGRIAVIKTDTNRVMGFLRWPTQRAKQWVKGFLSTVESDANILAVIAIGSSVRPNVTSLDLDLVVICQNLASFSHCPPMEVDVRKFDAADVRKEVQSGNDLLGWCVKFGVLLFERSAFWTDILREYSNHLPFPSAEVARERAEITKQRVENLLSIGDTEAALEQEISYFTHLARAVLIEHAVYPASRPELPNQLREIGETELADEFSRALESYRHTITS